MAKKKSNSLLFNTFVGEWVSIYTNVEQERVDENGEPSRALTMFEGFFVDEDGDMIFIGDQKDGFMRILGCVNRHHIVSIVLMQEAELSEISPLPDSAGLN